MKKEGTRVKIALEEKEIEINRLANQNALLMS